MGEPKVPQIGPRIRAERTRQELTIRALADNIGVSSSLISQIETGKSQPSVSTLYAITSALGLPIEELFDETSEVGPRRDRRTGDGAGLALPSRPTGTTGSDRTSHPTIASCSPWTPG